MDMDSTLRKVILIALIPVIGLPIAKVGYDEIYASFNEVNGTFSTDYGWVVTLYIVMMGVFFGLLPLGLLALVLKND